MVFCEQGSSQGSAVSALVLVGVPRRGLFKGMTDVSEVCYLRCRKTRARLIKVMIDFCPGSYGPRT